MNDPILDGLSSAILRGEDGGEEEDLYKDHVHTVLWLGKGSLQKKKYVVLLSRSSKDGFARLDGR